MVNDVLTELKHRLNTYSTVITQTIHPEFRQIIQETRNHSEALQYELLKVADNKGYYQLVSLAIPEEINTFQHKST